MRHFGRDARVAVTVCSQSSHGGLPGHVSEVWRFAGVDAQGLPVYLGYYHGQELAVSAPDADGNRLVTLSDPISGSSLGTLNDVRGSVRLGDGRVAYSGTYEGQQFNPVLNENGLRTIIGDLDITGNVLSLGSLTNASATAGTSWQFVDEPTSATLWQTLARDRGRWVWSRRDGDAGMHSAPVMELDSHGPSTLHGTLRVRPGGDIPMGDFTQSPAGLPTP